MTTQTGDVDRGLKAIRTHAKERVKNTIDDVVEARQDELNFKGTADDVRKAIYQIIDFSTMNTGERLSMLNHNSSYEKAADFVISYLEENPQEKSALPETIDEEIDVPVNETLGLNSDYYMQVCNALKENGLVNQKGGALNMVLDTVMKQLGDVVTLGCYINDKEYVDRDVVSEQNLLQEFGLAQSSDASSDTEDARLQYARIKADEVNEHLTAAGTSIEDIQGAYDQGGLKGTAEHLISSGLHSFEDELNEYINAVSAKGISLDLEGKDIASAYDKGGFTGYGGVADEVVLSALGSLDEEKESYIPMGVQAAVVIPNLIREMKEYVNEQGPNVSQEEMTQNFIGGVVSSVMMASMMGDDSEALSADRLQTVTRENGVFGDEGLIAYLGQEVWKKGMEHVEDGTLDEQDVKSAYEVFNTLQKANEPGTIPIRSMGENKWMKYAAGLDKKAQEHGVTPETLLSDDSYVQQRKEVFDETHMPAEIYQLQMEGNHQQIRQGLDMLLQLRQDITRENIDETLKDNRPQNGFLASAYDALTAPLKNRTAPERISDYITIMNGVSDSLFTQFESELASYTSS